MDNVHWPFIYDQEGGLRLTAYVPPDPGQNSGVTLAAGIDLGRIQPDTPLLRSIDSGLAVRFAPYLGKRGRNAVLVLQSKPLSVSAGEADQLMSLKKAEFCAAVRSHFDRGAAMAFSQVPKGPATVIMSVTWQYGDPWDDPKCGDFWRIAQSCHWRDLAAYLIDAPASGRPCFPDRRFQSRRKREGEFIRHTLNAGATA
jgi:hypothetical protein